MLPWEHLVVAYLTYSLVTNTIFRRAPSSRETVAVVVGSQLPDLIDKPLAWTLGITETSYSIGHSIFFAPIICLTTYVVATRLGKRSITAAFSIAYGSHLVTDVFDPTRTDRGLWPRAVLWPLESRPASDHGGLLEHFGRYFLRYIAQLLTGGLTPLVALQLTVGVAVVALWLFDGAPIAADIWRWLRTKQQS